MMKGVCFVLVLMVVLVVFQSVEAHQGEGKRPHYCLTELMEEASRASKEKDSKIPACGKTSCDIPEVVQGYRAKINQSVVKLAYAAWVLADDSGENPVVPLAGAKNQLTYLEDTMRVWNVAMHGTLN